MRNVAFILPFYFDVDEWELYDRKNDPHELKNVYNDPEYADIKNKLHEDLKDMRKKYGDSSQISQRLLEEYLRQFEKKGAEGFKDEQLQKILKMDTQLNLD